MAQVWGWPSAWLLTSQVRRADCTSPAAPGRDRSQWGHTGPTRPSPSAGPLPRSSPV